MEYPLLFKQLLLSLFFILAIIQGSMAWADKPAGNRGLVGGPCEYKNYRGQAQILSVQKIAGTKEGPEQFEVKYGFRPEEEITEAFARVEGREMVLLLGNSTYPTRRFLDKYGIEKGKLFDCTLKVIIRGTCTPTLFEFRSINLYDYGQN